MTNVVHVDFIGADYMGNNLKGFDKRMPAGYNGSTANLRKKGNGNGLDDGGNNGGGNVGGPNGGQKGGPKGGKKGGNKGDQKGLDGSVLGGGIAPGKHLTDE